MLNCASDFIYRKCLIQLFIKFVAIVTIIFKPYMFLKIKPEQLAH